MGRKKKSTRKKYSRLLEELDIFEQRWDYSLEQYYLYNPFTGERIAQENGIASQREFSTWGKPEPLCAQAQIVNAIPVKYASRCWGRRKFYGFVDQNHAATHIASIVRGWLTRKWMQDYYRRNFVKVFDEDAGLYYFHSYSTGETSWHKPLLAFPADILEHNASKDDYMHGEKLTYMGFTDGPYIKRIGIGKTNVKRTQVPNFIEVNPWRDIAIPSDPSLIDLDMYPLGALVSWMDGLTASVYTMTDYAVMRTLVTAKHWGGILAEMDLYAERELMQCYGLHALSKLDVPVDKSNNLTFEANAVYLRCLSIIKDESKLLIRKAFALRVLLGLVSTTAGRAEFLQKTRAVRRRTANDDEDVRRDIIALLTTLNRLLEHIPMAETAGDDGTVHRSPSARGVELVEYTISCLGSLSHSEDDRELIAQTCAFAIIHATKMCISEPTVALTTMKTLYDFCFRCEGGQEAVHEAGGEDLVLLVQSELSSDFEIARFSRRLHLALQPDGWRGEVDARMTGTGHIIGDNDGRGSRGTSGSHSRGGTGGSSRW